MEQPRRMYMIRGRDGLDDVLAQLRGGPLAIDTETTGLDWTVDRVGSINLAAGTTAIFVYRDALAPVVRYLSDQIKARREFVFHHAKFDMHMLRATFGLHFPYPVHDTMTESHLLDQRGVGTSLVSNHHLKDLARVHVDPHAQEPEKDLMRAIRQAGGRTKGDWLLAPWEIYAKYSAKDPWYTLQLHLQFLSRIRHWAQPEGYPPLLDLYRNEQWLTLALRDMEERGVQADRYYLLMRRRELTQEITKLKRQLVRLAGRDINWNSTPQLRDLLYSKRRGLGLGTMRKNKSGSAPSTDKKALVALDHPIGAVLLQYRKATKQLGTFTNGLLNAMDSNGVIHTSFRQNVDTGRMSATEGMHQMDKYSGARRGIVPRKGLAMRFADYSQIEMRIAAHLANEQTLLKGFREDPDFDMHAATAKIMFGVTNPTSEQRGYGKTMNFATLYGAGEDRVTEQLMDRMTVRDAYRSCKILGYTPSYAESPHRALARLLKQRYRQVMPDMPAAAKRAEYRAKKWGFSITVYGRHRWLQEDEAYTAFNSEDQGSAADCAKFGMVKLYRELQLGTGEIALQLQVHDEIIYESDGDPRTDRRVLELLEERRRFRVPIIADMKGTRRNWHEKETVRL